MSYKPVACEFARYNAWQNGQLLTICDTLDEAELTADRGMFFGGILQTLDHILLVDQTLLKFAQSGDMKILAAFDPAVRPSPNYAAYKSARHAADRNLLSAFNAAADAWFDDVLTFHSTSLGRDRSVPRWFYLAQMFNHQTHHRSQVTSALHRMGIDYGITDLPYNPQSQY